MQRETVPLQHYVIKTGKKCEVIVNKYSATRKKRKRIFYQRKKKGSEIVIISEINFSRPLIYFLVVTILF